MYQNKDNHTAIIFYKDIKRWWWQKQFNIGAMNKEKIELATREFYKAAAKQDYIPAQRNLGYYYHQGPLSSKKTKSKYKWLEKAALQGDVSAQFLLGKLYLSSSDTVEKGLGWLAQAFKEGNAEAAYQIALYYWSHSQLDQLSQFPHEREESLNKSIEWHKKAANLGYPLSQRQLGEWFRNGQFVTQNLQESFSWYELAGHQGDVPSQVALGDMLSLGVCSKVKRISLRSQIKYGRRVNGITKLRLPIEFFRNSLRQFPIVDSCD